MRNIHKSTPPSFRRRENAAAIVKAPPLGINFENRPTPDRGAVPNPAKRRRHAFSAVAFLAVLAVGLLFLLPGGLLQAQDASPINYPENGTDPVATYTGLDPEGRTVYWSLLTALSAPPEHPEQIDGDPLEEADIVDHEDFSISANGVLSFKLPPDFEMPKGAAPSVEAEAPMLAAQNVYRIVVVASDDAPGADGNDSREKAYHKVTVTVTDVDEDGSISFSAQQPQVGVALTATLKDEDADDTDDAVDGKQIGEKWKWYYCPAAGTTCAVIPGETDNTYTPGAVIVGRDLMAVATYKDASGSKEVEASAPQAVRAVPAGQNAAPVFPDDDSDADGSQQTREVNENSPPGTKVGKPVTAGDAGDILTYALFDDDTNAANDDNNLYRVDLATGQITVASRAMLNADADAGDRDTSAAGFQHRVMVRVIDPFADPEVASGETNAVGPGNSATVTVTITVKDVNEAPRITGGPTMTKQAERAVSTDDTDNVIVTTYKATDPESDVMGFICSECTWSASGPDSALFDIMESGTVDATVAQLTFKKAPNFEKPADANMDNVYMVTVVVTDPGMSTDRAIGVGKLTAMRDVAITVTNANDDGEITLSSQQPKIGTPFKAMLMDADGGVDDEKVKWQWRRADSDGSDPPTCPVSTEFGLPAAVISGAKSATYTPVMSPTTDVDQCLQVTATYTDSFGSTSAGEMAVNPVVADLENKAPEFKEGGDKPVMQATRYIIESADADDPVVANTDGTTNNTAADPDPDPVMATDPNPADTNLTHTLGGTDERYFNIAAANGQITVKEDDKLDYEKKKSYMVTVTATDPSQAMTTIDVTIMVVDVNEPPVIAGEDDLTKDFRENSTSAIETFRATDPERRTVYWSLKTADGGAYPADGSLTISSTTGALRFKAKPDYENPKSDGTNNTYPVRVVASDDAPDVGTLIMSSERVFNVRVTNAIEQESIAVSPMFAQVNATLTARLTAGDATPSDISEADWKWSGADEGTAADSPTATISAPATPGMIRVEVTYPALGKDRTKSANISVKAAPATNTPPTFPNADAARSVDENRPAGTVVDTFRATDDDSEHKNRLTYSVDNDSFEVTSNGQLKTAVMLNHEDAATQTVTITATDPSDGTGEVEVTITVNNVNEAPTIATGPTRVVDWPENREVATSVATYTFNTDPDGDDLSWSLAGPDGGDFNIGNQTGGSPGTLTFKEMPDYEMPAASNNLYRVTVEVSDGKLRATRPMTVMVTDVEEDGKVTLSSVQPKVAIDLTASLKDSDGDEENIEWQWARTATGDIDTPVNCTEVAENDWEDIDGAEMATYTPDDDDLYQCLQATASYTDRRGDGKTAMQESANVVIANTDNRAPMFKENDQEITETTRKVAENVGAKTLFGDGMDGTDDDLDDNEEPVMATDPNGDNLTYSLGGMDMASFDIERGTGQLITKAKLDYETKNRYMVTVTANDPNGLSASVDVTIMVTDVDEAPEIIAGGLVVTGTSDINYAENGTGMVATYSAAGPDAADATWSLSGADAGDLSISSAGVLTFMAPPNYESPADANTDNTYMVMVNANDGTNDAMKAVTVRVTNEDEPGEVTLWAGTDALTMAPQVGDTITGAVMDPDGGEMVESWQWSRTMDTADMNSWMDIQDATDAAYMVTADDTGYHLRVMATYTDAAGTDMAMEYSMSTMMVTGVVEMMGEVTLWAGDDALTMAPQVGETITGAVMDPDGGVTGESWQWSRTMTPDMMASWMDIQDATDAAYMVTAGDTGYYLRVMATYTDAVGTDTAMEYSMPTMMVTAVDETQPADFDPLAKYDADKSGGIEKDEVIQAINDYLFGEGADAISKDDVIETINLYLFG